MKKNGFTLIELICVIVLLSIVVTISVTMFINSINKSRERENKATMALIKTATYEYMMNHDYKNSETYCIPISDLINDDLISSNIKYNGEDISNKVVTVVAPSLEYYIEEPSVCQTKLSH